MTMSIPPVSINIHDLGNVGADNCYSTEQLAQAGLSADQITALDKLDSGVADGKIDAHTLAILDAADGHADGKVNLTADEFMTSLKNIETEMATNHFDLHNASSEQLKNLGADLYTRLHTSTENTSDLETAQPQTTTPRY